MDCNTPGFCVHHQLPEIAQTHVHQVGDAIQPSHPLSSPSPPAFSLSQHQGLFQRVGHDLETEQQQVKYRLFPCKRLEPEVGIMDASEGSVDP